MEELKDREKKPEAPDPARKLGITPEQYEAWKKERMKFLNWALKERG